MANSQGLYRCLSGVHGHDFDNEKIPTLSTDRPLPTNPHKLTTVTSIILREFLPTVVNAPDSHLAQLILKSRRQPTDFPRGFLAGRALDSSSRAGAADPPDPHARVLRTVWTSTFLPNPAL